MCCWEWINGWRWTPWTPWLLPQPGKSGYGSTNEVVMDRAVRPEQGSSSWQRRFNPKGLCLPSCSAQSKGTAFPAHIPLFHQQHHELYAWKHLMSSGCIRHLSIPALGLSFTPSTILPSLPRAAVPGGLFPPFSRNLGGRECRSSSLPQAEPAHPIISSAQPMQGCSRQEQGSGIWGYIPVLSRILRLILHCIPRVTDPKAGML